MNARRITQGVLSTALVNRNNTGFLAFLIQSLPLLDAGVCYGVQTVYAMKAGRDVLALDACQEHIDVLLERVSKLEMKENTGRLVGAVVAKLPAGNVIRDESVSGILCSEQGRSSEDVYGMLKNLSASELVDAAPGIGTTPAKEFVRNLVGRS